MHKLRLVVGGRSKAFYMRVRRQGVRCNRSAVNKSFRAGKIIFDSSLIGSRCRADVISGDSLFTAINLRLGLVVTHSAGQIRRSRVDIISRSQLLGGTKLLYNVCPDCNRFQRILPALAVVGVLIGDSNTVLDMRHILCIEHVAVLQIQF